MILEVGEGCPGEKHLPGTVDEHGYQNVLGVQMMDDGSLAGPGGRVEKGSSWGFVKGITTGMAGALESGFLYDVWVGVSYRAWRLVSKGTTQ